MIIKKIIEYSQKGIAEEKYLLLIEEKEEGWELSRSEMIKLKDLSNMVFDYNPIYRQITPPPIYPYIAPVTTLLGSSEIVASYDDAHICPDYIEPPESTETAKNVQKEVENEPKQAEKVQKEGKKTQKRAVRDFSKYIEMANNECSRRMILDAMIKDFGVAESTAVTYYHSKIRTKPIPQKMMVKDPILKEEIAALPDYGSYTDFKDALARTDVGRGRYTVKALKTMYLDTHPHIKW